MQSKTTVPSPAPSRVSVIIPTRNRATLVGEAIASVLDQDVDGVEVIVVDDGSTDDTARVLAGFGERIRALTLPQARGVAAARNAAIEIARGRWLAFLDSDDLWLPGKLNAQLEVMDTDPAIRLSFTDYAVDALSEGGLWRQTAVHGNRPGPRDFATLFRRNYIGTLTVLLRRDCLEAVGGFDETLVRGSDYDLWLRIAERWKVQRVPGVLARYRRHRSSLTGLDPQRDLMTYAAITKRWIERDAGILARVGWTEEGWQDWIESQRRDLMTADRDVGVSKGKMLH